MKMSANFEVYQLQASFYLQSFNYFIDSIKSKYLKVFHDYRIYYLNYFEDSNYQDYISILCQ